MREEVGEPPPSRKKKNCIGFKTRWKVFTFKTKTCITACFTGLQRTPEDDRVSVENSGADGQIFRNLRLAGAEIEDLKRVNLKKHHHEGKIPEKVGVSGKGGTPPEFDADPKQMAKQEFIQNMASVKEKDATNFVEVLEALNYRQKIAYAAPVGDDAKNRAVAKNRAAVGIAAENGLDLPSLEIKDDYPYKIDQTKKRDAPIREYYAQPIADISSCLYLAYGSSIMASKQNQCEEGLTTVEDFAADKIINDANGQEAAVILEQNEQVKSKTERFGAHDGVQIPKVIAVHEAFAEEARAAAGRAAGLSLAVEKKLVQDSCTKASARDKAPDLVVLPDLVAPDQLVGRNQVEDIFERVENHTGDGVVMDGLLMVNVSGNEGADVTAGIAAMLHENTIAVIHVGAYKNVTGARRVTWRIISSMKKQAFDEAIAALDILDLQKDTLTAELKECRMLVQSMKLCDMNKEDEDMKVLVLLSIAKGLLQRGDPFVYEASKELVSLENTKGMQHAIKGGPKNHVRRCHKGAAQDTSEGGTVMFVNKVNSNLTPKKEYKVPEILKADNYEVISKNFQLYLCSREGMRSTHMSTIEHEHVSDSTRISAAVYEEQRAAVFIVAYLMQVWLILFEETIQRVAADLMLQGKVSKKMQLRSRRNDLLFCSGQSLRLRHNYSELNMRKGCSQRWLTHQPGHDDFG